MDLNKKYFGLILIHLMIGILIYKFPFMAKIYAYASLLYGIYFTVKNKNANHEVLYASAYIVGCEVFLRMSHGNLNYEFAKFSVMLFSLLGIFYSGFLKKSWPYWLFLLLLVPGILIATQTLSPSVVAKISFDISGPVCLGICSIYTFRKKITAVQVNNLLLTIGLPIISCGIYLFLRSPEMKTIHFNTESSFALSGGFGPNQVATALGLGMIVFFSRLILQPFRLLYIGLNFIIATYLCYRGFLTFSRGGMLVALITIIVLLFFVYVHADPVARKQLYFRTFLIFVSFSGMFFITSYQSKGLVEKRYANEDKHGKPRIHKATGRFKVALGEIQMFAENPIFGIGSGRGKEIRTQILGKRTSTHNEITRLLAEHGVFGLAAILILIAIPVFLYFDHKKNIYLAAFFVFWLLTISHSGMRTAAPSFIYALALLNIKPHKILQGKRGLS
jgi:hypothetical protein